MRRKTASASVAIVLLLLAVSGVLVYQRMSSRPRTDDAFIEADVIHLAPEVSGRIVSLKVRNNQQVQAGAVLFIIDPQPFQLKLDEARAQTHSLEDKIADASGEVASQASRADAAHTAVGNARAQLGLAASTLARLEPLLQKGFVTALQVDQARTARDSAKITLEQAIQQAAAARQAVQSVRPLREQLEASRASEALAARDLEKSVVRAPFGGKVIGLNIAVGEYAVSGHPLFTLIDTSRWYAVANFRETEVARMSAGTPATVYLMSQPRNALHGQVESIGWGVTPDDASLVNGMPRVAKTLDWVRLAQRFPVRILLDAPPQNAMRIGASAVVVVRHGD
ncbi:MAG: multidrug transporter subunit MdtN [Desulfovibrionaceae bacterium CG1_02_65_16]|nr:MAG: multidrug transporter subunit MdtN [Desulfovibrionaceae bacterium CG1_02_65_16]